MKSAVLLASSFAKSGSWPGDARGRCPTEAGPERALRRLPVGVDGRVELGEGRVAHERRRHGLPAGDEAEGQLGQACARMRLGVASMASAGLE